MASIDTVYNDIGKLFNLANAANDANWNSDTDLGDQAARLEEIVVLAQTNAPLLRKLDKALG